MLSFKMQQRKIVILGSTGSIGSCALDVIRQHPQCFDVVALTANNNVQQLIQQCKTFKPSYAAIANPHLYAELKSAIANLPTQAMSGQDALLELAALPQSDTLITALVGIAGLEPTLHAIRQNKRILLANKEILVSAGELVMREVMARHVELLPIDSEHSALFQCLEGSQGTASEKPAAPIDKVILTASGGPFRTTQGIEFDNITPQQACAHPNWEMGQKISIDSATLMNKGFEVIEACYLFNFAPKQIEVLVHPQSIVHALVQWQDGSVVAQMAIPDMYIPIAYALAWPQRLANTLPRLNLLATKELTFEKVQHDKFPCLNLAYAALQQGNAALIALNAANEVAVAEFLKQTIRFSEIPLVIEKTVNHIVDQSKHDSGSSLEHILECHQFATEYAQKELLAR